MIFLAIFILLILYSIILISGAKDQIRKIKPEDEKIILEGINKIFPTNYYKLNGYISGRSFVLVYDNEIKYLFVEESERKKGLGTKLLLKVLKDGIFIILMKKNPMFDILYKFYTKYFNILASEGKNKITFSYKKNSISFNEIENELSNIKKNIRKDYSKVKEFFFGFDDKKDPIYYRELFKNHEHIGCAENLPSLILGNFDKITCVGLDIKDARIENKSHYFYFLKSVKIGNIINLAKYEFKDNKIVEINKKEINEYKEIDISELDKYKDFIIKKIKNKKVYLEKHYEFIKDNKYLHYPFINNMISWIYIKNIFELVKKNIYIDGDYIISHYYESIYIIDYFNEKERLTCMRKNQNLNFLEYFEKNKQKIEFNGEPYLNLDYHECSEFNPAWAYIIYKHFGAKNILDMCAGRGSRMCGAFMADADYYLGIDPNKKTNENIRSLGYLLNYFGYKTKWDIIDSGFEKDWEKKFPIDKKFDIMLTSPPYYDLEIYDKNDTGQSIWNKTFEEWINDFLYVCMHKVNKFLKKGAYMIINIDNSINEEIKDDYITPLLKFPNYKGKLNLIYYQPVSFWIFQNN